MNDKWVLIEAKQQDYPLLNSRKVVIIFILMNILYP
jgi:hypothetical protein